MDEMLLRDEMPADAASIDRVHREAFGRDDEARLVRALRAGGFSRISIVAESAGQIVGHILLSEVSIFAGPERRSALSLGPLAVLPAFQRQGVGAALVRRAMDECARQGHGIVLVLGEPAYYQRFGFSAKLAAELSTPYAGPYFMAARSGTALGDCRRGRVEYSPPFAQLT